MDEIKYVVMGTVEIIGTTANSIYGDADGFPFESEEDAEATADMLRQETPEAIFKVMVIDSHRG